MQKIKQYFIDNPHNAVVVIAVGVLAAAVAWLPAERVVSMFFMWLVVSAGAYSAMRPKNKNVD